MSDDVLNAKRMLPLLKNIILSNRQEVTLKRTNISTQQKPRMQKILHKYRIDNLLWSFKSKIKRNNQYSQPVQFQINSGLEKDEQRWIKLQGIDFPHKKLETTVFVGDILFSLLIFYLSVFQAFLPEFRNQIAGSAPVLIIKILAVLFQFLKITLKSVKKEVVEGIWMTFLTDIIFYSAGFTELIVSFSAIFIIIISATNPGDPNIATASFLIAAVKLFLIPKNIKVLEIHYINSVRKQQYWDLIKVIIFEMLFGHFISGLLLAMAQLNPTQNWIVNKNLAGSSWNTLYQWAIYWSATLITTTGFGDITATTSDQAIIVAFIQFFSSAVLVYNINLIGTIVLNMRRSDCTLEKKLAIFRRMNDQNPVAPNLEGKIRSFISFENQIKELFQFNERSALLKQLPQQLQKQYNNNVNQSIFKQLPFFRHLRTQSMISLANQFQARVYYPGEYLIRNRLGICTVFILRNGKVGSIYQRDSSLMNGVVVDETTVKGDSSGDRYQPSLLTKTFMKRSSTINYDIKALDYSLIMSIRQEDLLDILRKSSLDFQHFCTIYDKHEIDFRFEREVCSYCENQYHNKFQCPRMHYIPFKFIVVYNYLNHPFQNNSRNRWYRRNSLRKEHCYYLRIDFFKMYEKANNINTKRYITQLIDQLQFCTTHQQNYISKQQFFQQCEKIIRKVVEERRLNENEEKEFFWCIDCDTVHDFVAYFLQCNPSKLVCIKLNKDRKKRTRRLFTVATNLSNKLLYRNDLPSVPQRNWDSCRPQNFEINQ